MNGKLIATLLVLVVFMGLTAEVLLTYGLVGWIEPIMETRAGQLVSIDLVINLFILLGFIRHDAKERGLPYLPFVVITLTTGAAGPLSYLVARELWGMRQEQRA